MPCQTIEKQSINGLDSAIQSELIMINCAGTESGVHLTIGGDILTDPVAVEALPATMALAVAGTDQIAASIVNAEGEKLDVTGICKYSSSDPAVATVNNGLVTGVAPGSATITVLFDRYGFNLSDTVAVTVT